MKRKKKKSHISYVCQRRVASCHGHSYWYGMLCTYKYGRRVVIDTCNSYCHTYVCCAQNYGRRVRKKSCHGHSYCCTYVCCVLETMKRESYILKRHAYVMLWANRRKRIVKDTQSSRRYVMTCAGNNGRLLSYYNSTQIPSIHMLQSRKRETSYRDSELICIE